MKTGSPPGAWTWAQATLLAALDLYQVSLRLLNPWGCKFHPSCSHYARQAIELHGAGRGGWLATRRLLRCRPGTRGGFDPVPEPLPPMERAVTTDQEERAA